MAGLNRRTFIATAAAAPLAAALPAISGPVEAAAIIAAPSPEMWIAAFNAVYRQSLQDLAIYGCSQVHFPEGGLPYAIDPLSLMRGPVEPA